MTRAERAAEAQRLRAEGLKYREVAERMGISISYAGELCHDPEGHKIKARKESYRRPCVDCGVLLHGSSGFNGKKAPTRCNACRAIADTIWTRETIVAAIRRFHARYGYPPVAPDFNPALARQRGRPEAAERFYRDNDYPTHASVQRVFGDNYWNKAIAAAGFDPLAPGHKLVDFSPEKQAEAVALYRSGLSGLEVAGRVGCTPTSVYRWLRKADVCRRPRWPERQAA